MPPSTGSGRAPGDPAAMAPAEWLRQSAGDGVRNQQADRSGSGGGPLTWEYSPSRGTSRQGRLCPVAIAKSTFLRRGYYCRCDCSPSRPAIASSRAARCLSR